MDENIRPVLELMGNKGRLSQGAKLELLVSLVNAELGLTIPISVSTLPTIGISSIPNLTIASVPSLTANPTRPTLLAQVLLTGSDATLYTAAANWRDVSIYLKNVDSIPHTAQVGLGTTFSDTNALIKNAPLSVGARWPIHVPALANGDKIRGQCDLANKVSVEIWGVSA